VPQRTTATGTSTSTRRSPRMRWKVDMPPGSQSPLGVP
jgi:hypothetical protein